MIWPQTPCHSEPEAKNLAHAMLLAVNPDPHLVFLGFFTGYFNITRKNFLGISW